MTTEQTQIATAALRAAMERRDQPEVNVRLLELTTLMGGLATIKLVDTILNSLPAETQAWWQHPQPRGAETLATDALIALRSLLTEQAEKTSALRLRMKVWTKPGTDTMYLAASAYFDGRAGRLIVYVMRDEETLQLALTVDEWNALPFRYFKEDGEAPRPENMRDMDRVGGGPIKPGGGPIKLPDTGN